MPPLNAALETVRQVAIDVAAPHAEAVDADGRWPEESIEALFAGGLGGLVLPEPAGGLGHGLLALGQACEELGRACGSTALCFGMHCVGAAVLAAKATPDQVDRYLVPIAAGRHLTTLAVSEPGTGSQFYLPETALVDLGGEGYRANGTKSFVTNASRADSYVVSATMADDDTGPGLFSCIVVPRETSGVKLHAGWSGVGMRGNDARTVELQDVLLPRGNLLGEEGDQIWYVFNVITPYFLAAMSGAYLGVATSALEEVREHLSRRRYSHSGERLAQRSIVQHRLGELWGALERSRRLLYSAASDADAGAPDALPAMMAAKAEVADVSVLITNEAMSLAGGIGYSARSSLDRHLRDARAAPVMAPTPDQLRLWIGRGLLGLPLLGD